MANNSKLSLTTAVQQFTSLYKEAVSAKAQAASIYADYVKQAGGAIHKAEFKQAVNKANSGFVISERTWRLLWYVGTGALLPDFLERRNNAGIGLTVYELGFTVDAQRTLIHKGYTVASPHTDVPVKRKFTSALVTRGELLLAFKPGGEARPFDEQLQIVKSRKHTKFTREQLITALMADDCPLDPKDLRGIAAARESHTNFIDEQ